MKSLSLFLLGVLLSFSGCTMRQSADSVAKQTANAQKEQAHSNDSDRDRAGFVGDSQAKQAETFALNRTEKAISIESAIDRKIIRDADLTIEVTSTTEAQQRVTSIAETLGGFVVTSEVKQRENADPAKRTV